MKKKKHLIIYFLDYNTITLFLHSFSSLQILPYTSPYFLSIMRPLSYQYLLHTYMYMPVFYIPKCILLALHNDTCYSVGYLVEFRDPCTKGGRNPGKARSSDSLI